MFSGTVRSNLDPFDEVCCVLLFVHRESVSARIDVLCVPLQQCRFVLPVLAAAWDRACAVLLLVHPPPLSGTAYAGVIHNRTTHHNVNCAGA